MRSETAAPAGPEARTAEYLRREFGQEGGGELLGRLLDRGLIDLRAAERGAVRQRVAELQRAGSGRVDAMFRVAEEFCCSNEKTRSIIYRKLKNP